MGKFTIKEIEEKLDSINQMDDPFIKTVSQDERKGVQQVLKKWTRKIEQKELAENLFNEMTEFERKYRNEGYLNIAGIDEVGRGPLAGPVVAAAVILPESFYLLGINDSKKLTEKKREEYYEKIIEHAIDFHVALVEPCEIDDINIYEATKKAMLASINGLSINPDFLLVDAVKLVSPYPQEAIIKGDAKSISIAAASIVAKVTRDRLMKKIAEEYPHYGFDQNMGYGTKEHLLALQVHGVTPHHRKSFAPIKDMLL